jgi:diguanylate cyclase (GGDEF)-like protein
VTTDIGRYGLFRDAPLEAAFLAAQWRGVGARLTLVGVWGGAAILAAGIADWLLLPAGSPMLWWLTLLRLGCAALGLRLSRLVGPTREPAPRRVAGALLQFQLALIVTIKIASLAYGGYSPDLVISSLLLTLAFYAYVPTLSPANLWLLPLSALITLPEVVFVLHAPPRGVGGYILIMGVANLLGWHTAVAASRAQRQNWLAHQSLRREADERLLAEQNLQQIFEVCPVPLVLSSEGLGRVLRLNGAAQALLGGADGFASPEARAAVEQALHPQHAAQGVDLRLPTTAQGPVEVMLAARRLRHDGEAAVLTSLVEITQRKRHEQELLRLTQVDPLTGLYNRRGLFALAEAMLRHAELRPVSVLLLDADHFKAINDQHGHAAGDLALQQMAARMSAVLRATDMLARIGGEEFAALLPNTAADAALHLAERLRGALAAAPLLCNAVELPMTVSVGVVQLRDDELALDHALSRADSAMYRAKHGGRNRVEVAAPDQSSAAQLR